MTEYEEDICDYCDRVPPDLHTPMVYLDVPVYYQRPIYFEEEDEESM